MYGALGSVAPLTDYIHMHTTLVHTYTHKYTHAYTHAYIHTYSTEYV